MTSQNAKLSRTFKHYVDVTSVGQSLTEADRKEIRDKGTNKMLKECCGDDVAKASEAQVFPKFADKRTKKLKLDVFLGDFLSDLAAAVVQNNRKQPRRPDPSDPEVVSLLAKIKEQIAAKCDAAPKEVKVDAVTARLTDTKGYTGSHKERFDEQGKGRGIAGRKDISDTSGYVTGFKGQREGSPSTSK